jgi:hypothetical protein
LTTGSIGFTALKLFLRERENPFYRIAAHEGVELKPFRIIENSGPFSLDDAVLIGATLGVLPFLIFRKTPSHVRPVQRLVAGMSTSISLCTIIGVNFVPMNGQKGAEVIGEFENSRRQKRQYCIDLLNDPSFMHSTVGKETAGFLQRWVENSYKVDTFTSPMKNAASTGNLSSQSVQPEQQLPWYGLIRNAQWLQKECGEETDSIGNLIKQTEGFAGEPKDEKEAIARMLDETEFLRRCLMRRKHVLQQQKKTEEGGEEWMNQGTDEGQERPK